MAIVGRSGICRGDRITHCPARAGAAIGEADDGDVNRGQEFLYEAAVQGRSSARTVQPEPPEADLGAGSLKLFSTIIH